MEGGGHKNTKTEKVHISKAAASQYTKGKKKETKEKQQKNKRKQRFEPFRKSNEKRSHIDGTNREIESKRYHQLKRRGFGQGLFEKHGYLFGVQVLLSIVASFWLSNPSEVRLGCALLEQGIGPKATNIPEGLWPLHSSVANWLFMILFHL